MSPLRVCWAPDQILFSLPEPDPWVLLDGWHMDCGFDHATWPVQAVTLFACVGEVGPRGGGTMVLPGTHRLVDRYRETHLHVFHARSPDTAAAPRLMVGKEIRGYPS